MINATNYIDIQGWMVTELGLRGKDLMTYAIVYGFSQDGRGWFCAGRRYIAEWLGCNAKTAGAILTRMTKSGLLKCEDAVTKNGKVHRYQAVELGAKNALTKGENEPTRGEKRPRGRAKNAHITTKEDYKEELNNIFTKPTVEEIDEYARSRNAPSSFDAQYFFDYYESTGWMRGKSKMNDWKSTVRTWIKNEESIRELHVRSCDNTKPRFLTRPSNADLSSLASVIEIGDDYTW